MKEIDFQALYNLYTKAESHAERQECIETLHRIIYKYPSLRFGCDRDTSSDFYLKIFEKIPGYFEEYKPQSGYSFSMFICVKLRFAFYRFIGSKEVSISKNNELALDYDFSSSQNSNKTSLDFFNLIIEKALTNLADKNQLLMRLYYAFPLLIRELRYLVKVHNSLEAFAHYREYLQVVQEALKKEKYTKLRAFENLQRDGLNEERRLKLLKKFFESKPIVTYKQIANLVKETISLVQRKIKESEGEIKNELIFTVKEFRSLINKS